MRACLNQSTLLQVSTETFLQAAAGAGFRDVELRVPRVWDTLDAQPARTLRHLIADLGLRVAALNSLEEFSLVPEENLALMDRRAEAMCETCRLVGAGVLIMVPSRLTVPLGPEMVRARTVDRLRRYAAVAEPYDVALAFEPIGDPGSSIRTLAGALAVVAGADRPNVGLAVDTTNAYLAGDPPSAVDPLPVDRILIVHFQDSAPGPRDRLTLASRVLPGEGVIDLAGYAAALRRLGYAGPLSIEVFNERLWAMSPAQAVDAAMTSLRPFLE